MNYLHSIWFFLVLCFCNSAFSQNSTLELSNPNIQTGIDYKNKSYLVFNDFKSYHKKPFESKEWQTIDYKFNELPVTKDFPYLFFHIKEKNYLVYSGCGEVYELKNDSIIRVDKSFQHKNQFNAASFVYNNEIYFFGGYGLFTFKNILTKFDFKTKEWELVKYSNSDNLPLPRDKTISFLKDDYLYIVSGITEELNKSEISSKQLFDVWKLNLKTKIWEKIGSLNNTDGFRLSFNENSYQSNSKFYTDFGRLMNIDFENNEIIYYDDKFLFQSSHNEKYNTTNNEIIYATTNTDESKKKLVVSVESFKNYSGKPIKTEKLIANPYLNFLIYLSIGIVFLGLVFFLITKKPKQKTPNSICFKSNSFYYKDKIISNLANDENELLMFLFKNKSAFLQMNELVDFISKNDSSNYNTLTKKKDLVLGGLKQKLSFILGIHEDDLFIYQKNNEDKRIKEIQLNPEYFI